MRGVGNRQSQNNGGEHGTIATTEDELSVTITNYDDTSTLQNYLLKHNRSINQINDEEIEFYSDLLANSGRRISLNNTSSRNQALRTTNSIHNSSQSSMSDAIRSLLHGRDGDNDEGGDGEYEYEGVHDEESDHDDAEGDADATVTRTKQQINEIKSQFKKERRIVTFWRRILYLTLFILAIGLVWVTALAAKTHRNIPFNEQFTSLAQTMEYQITLGWNHTIEALNEFSYYLASYAIELQQSTAQENVYSASVNSWPYVSIIAFDALTSNLVTTTSVNHLTIAPLVSSNALWTWSSYSVINQGWITKSNNSNSIRSGLYQFDSQGNVVNVTKELTISSGLPAAPVWQTNPIPNQQDINFNILSLVDMQDMYKTMNRTKSVVAGEIGNQSKSWLPSLSKSEASGLTSTMMIPVFKVIDNNHNRTSTASIVGMVLVEMDWMQQLSTIFFRNVNSNVGVNAILRNTCGGSSHTFTIYPDQMEYVGMGDQHDSSYNDHVYETKLSYGSEFQPSKNVEANNDYCQFSVAFYPTSELYASMKQSFSMEIIALVIVWICFVLVVLSFRYFNKNVSRNNKNMIAKAAESNRILSSLFPSTVRDRLFQASAEPEVTNINDQLVSRNKSRSDMSVESGDYPGRESRRNSFGTQDLFIEDEDEDVVVFKTKPIADLFPAVTIMFTDLAGFTAWSSVREPSHVFTLLESLYHAFDEIARKRRVFKVETVGDCYVAVTGLPEPREDHAVVMARFANDCLKKTRIVTKKLTVVLGPDTEDLTMRCGLHSGQVTAGVLRGERSRFQLFGDTMNTASRMESTGIKDRIQISQETADELIAAGKVHWLTPREDKVIAKGKGEVETYWLVIDPVMTVPVEENYAVPALRDVDDVEKPLPQVKLKRHGSRDSLTNRDKNARLVDWNVETLLRQLKLISVYRQRKISSQINNLDKPCEKHEGKTVLEEVQEVIKLPDFNAKFFKNCKNVDDVELPAGVEEEVRDYVTMISQLYRRNPFHNFEHASHVTMSVNKLLSRIVQPATDVVLSDDISGVDKKKTASELHCFSYGITSDPLTHFACSFSALIHDVDHSGIPNSVLAEENTLLAEKYKGKSIAEQNSVDIAWDLLLRDEYTLFRRAIYFTPEEQTRFRQLVVNSVMATDIMDKDLKQLRNNRWDKAFSDITKMSKEEQKDNFNRKATIVIEHLIQASDVAHTMQHWHIYRKWNERLFSEMLLAYRDGRTKYDPSANWYEGELGFFDNYIIPLAKKLKDCGVFGVSSDEYLNYAQHNRNEFAERGKALIEEMVQRYQ